MWNLVLGLLIKFGIVFVALELELRASRMQANTLPLSITPSGRFSFPTPPLFPAGCFSLSFHEKSLDFFAFLAHAI